MSRVRLNAISPQGTDAADTPNGRDLIDIIYAKNENNLVYGNHDNDKIYGSAYYNSFYDKAGDDYITENQCIDLLEGGAGNDFIMDFEGARRARGDIRQISATLYNKISDILNHLTYGSGNALIRLNHDGTIILVYIVPDTLTAHDFKIV